jgi:hypothetical protein
MTKIDNRCAIWWKVRSCLPSPLEAAVLQQSLQDQLPCKNSQGLFAHEKIGLAYELPRR